MQPHQEALPSLPYGGEDWSTERLSDFSEVTPVLSGEARFETRAFCLCGPGTATPDCTPVVTVLCKGERGFFSGTFISSVVRT